MIKNRQFLIVLACIVFFCCAREVLAGEGHYAPGVLNIRDMVMPPKGFYYVQYNPFYHSGKYFDKNAKELRTLEFNRSVRILGFNIDVSIDANIDLKVQSGAISPTLIYITGQKIFGANYGFYIAPAYGYSKVKVKAQITKAAIDGIKIKWLTGKKIELEEDRSGIGDLLVTPVWLDWSADKYDIYSTYGFYAPIGEYDTDHFTNIGLDFWSHELSLGGAYYLNKNKATAFVLNGNYEINSKQRHNDVRPGQHLTLEYGISQYLSERLDIALTGYSVWQTTNDSGSDSRNKKTKDYVHGVGAQIGYWLVKDKFNATLRYTYEYAAQDRFKGEMASANFTFVF